MNLYYQLQAYFSEERTAFVVNCTTILLGLFVFFAPFRSYLTALWDISFYLSLTLCLVLVSLKKIKFSFKTPLTIPIACFFAWAIIGLFFALYPENSVHDVIFHLLKYIIAFFLLFNFFKTPERFLNLTWVLVISGIIFNLWVIIYFYVYLGHGYTLRLYITSFSVNTIGFISLPTLILSLFKFDEAKNIFEKIILIAAILLSTIITIQSIASVLGLFISLPIIGFVRKRTVIIYAISLIILFVVIISNVLPLHNRFEVGTLAHKFKSEERIGIWHLYSNVIRDYPITGIGYSLEMWQYPDFWNKYSEKVPNVILPEEVKKINLDPHNVFLSVAVHTGIVGLIIFAAILIAFIGVSINLIRNGKIPFVSNWAACIFALFIGYLVKGMAEEGLSNVGIVIFYVLLAMISILHAMNENEHVKNRDVTI
jgi:O-antigen ligase